MLVSTTKAKAAATVAAFAVVLCGCTQPDGPVDIGGASFSGTLGPERPSAQPSSSCPTSTGAPAAVYGATFEAFGFLRADAGGVIGPAAREVVDGRAVTRHGDQLRIAANSQEVASIGRDLAVLYDSGRVFVIDSETCTETGRHDISAKDLAVPAGSDLLFDGLARSAGPAKSIWVYGRYSPPDKEDYQGFVVELDAELTIGRHETYEPQVVTDVWQDGLGAPLVLLDDGTVREVGRQEPVVAPSYRNAKACLSVSRGTSGVWVVGGQEGANFMRLPSGRVIDLPAGSFATPVVAHNRDAVVLLRSRAEARIVSDSGASTTVALGRFPADVLTIGDQLLAVARDADQAWIIDWRRKKVVTTFPVGPAPVRLLPLG